MKPTMKSILVWDLPTRLCHWLLMAGCFSAFAVAITVSKHSKAFDIHMLLGMFLVPLIVFRLIWGIWGTKYVRFREFLYTPREAVEYLTGMATGKAARHIGHNPAASYAILAMLALLLGSVVSGALVSTGKFFEELHEATSFLLMGVVGAHLLGVLVHTIVHKENIVLSMIDGKKMAPDGDGIPSSHRFGALALLAATAIWSAVIVSCHDSVSRKVNLPLLGVSIQLGEDKPHGKHHGHNGDDGDD